MEPLPSPRVIKEGTTRPLSSPQHNTLNTALHTTKVHAVGIDGDQRNGFQQRLLGKESRPISRVGGIFQSAWLWRFHGQNARAQGEDQKRSAR